LSLIRIILKYKRFHNLNGFEIYREENMSVIGKVKNVFFVAEPFYYYNGGFCFVNVLPRII
jgi:hypothetical protein